MLTQDAMLNFTLNSHVWGVCRLDFILFNKLRNNCPYCMQWGWTYLCLQFVANFLNTQASACTQHVLTAALAGRLETKAKVVKHPRVLISDVTPWWCQTESSHWVSKAPLDTPEWFTLHITGGAATQPLRAAHPSVLHPQPGLPAAPVPMPPVLRWRAACVLLKWAPSVLLPALRKL